MSSQSSTVRYVLQGLNWRRTPDFPLSLPDPPGCIVLREDEPPEPEQRQHWIRSPGEVRIASFEDSEEAEKDRWQRERAIRCRINPFRCGGDEPRQWTDLDESGLRSWMRTQGIVPPLGPAEAQILRRIFEPAKSRTQGVAPPEAGESWADWYDRCQGGWDDKRREAIWEPLTKVRFFEVVQRPCTAPVFAVVKVNVGNTGGELLGVYRSRDRAEAERQQQLERLAEELRSEDVGELKKENFPALCLSANKDPFGGDLTENDEFLKASDWNLPFYRIVELDWGDGGDVRGAVAVVQQVELCLLEPVVGNKARQLIPVCDEYDNQALIPILVFADRESADRFVATKEAEARRFFPPFLLYGPPPSEEAFTVDAVLSYLELDSPLSYHPPGKLDLDKAEAGIWEKEFEKWWLERGAKLPPYANISLWDSLCSKDPYFYTIEEVTLQS